MGHIPWIALCGTLISGTNQVPAEQSVASEQREGRPCIECHREIGVAFAGTRMAEAASGAAYLDEWVGRGRPAWCVRCHAPSGGKGLVCADCHGAGPHPYPKLLTPDVCARCHDAPGESTVRRFLAGPAPRRGEDCLSCHISEAPPGADHAFQGPSAPGFLEAVASLRVFLRGSATEDGVAVLQIRHRAGHALPGGTTGRSVWLLVEGIRADGTEAWKETVRYGWEHHPDRGWIDRTLPPGRSAVIELTGLRRGGAVTLSAELWYRFRPGPFLDPDPRAVRLDQVQVEL